MQTGSLAARLVLGAVFFLGFDAVFLRGRGIIKERRSSWSRAASRAARETHGQEV